MLCCYDNRAEEDTAEPAPGKWVFASGVDLYTAYIISTLATTLIIVDLTHVFLMFPISHSEFGSRINQCTFCPPGAFSFAVVICERIWLMIESQRVQFNSKSLCRVMATLLIIGICNYILWPNLYWAKCRWRFHSNTVFTHLAMLWSATHQHFSLVAVRGFFPPRFAVEHSTP